MWKLKSDVVCFVRVPSLISNVDWGKKAWVVRYDSTSCFSFCPMNYNLFLKIKKLWADNNPIHRSHY